MYGHVISHSIVMYVFGGNVNILEIMHTTLKYIFPSLKESPKHYKKRKGGKDGNNMKPVKTNSRKEGKCLPSSH